MTDYILDPNLSMRFQGGFFTADPAKTIRANIRDMLEAIAQEAALDVIDHFPVGGAGDKHPGLGRAGVIGRVNSLTGKRWAYHAVVSQQAEYPWPRKGGRGFTGRSQARYRGGKLEAQLHMFRNAAKRIRTSRALLSADLTAGLE